MLLLRAKSEVWRSLGQVSLLVSSLWPRMPFLETMLVILTSGFLKWVTTLSLQPHILKQEVPETQALPWPSASKLEFLSLLLLRFAGKTPAQTGVVQPTDANFSDALNKMARGSAAKEGFP